MINLVKSLNLLKITPNSKLLIVEITFVIRSIYLVKLRLLNIKIL